jgi:hypothetical protein
MIHRIPVLLQAFDNKRSDLLVIFDDQDSHIRNLPEFDPLRECHCCVRRLGFGVWLLVGRGSRMGQGMISATMIFAYGSR